MPKVERRPHAGQSARSGRYQNHDQCQSTTSEQIAQCEHGTSLGTDSGPSQATGIVNALITAGDIRRVLSADTIDALSRLSDGERALACDRLKERFKRQLDLRDFKRLICARRDAQQNTVETTPAFQYEMTPSGIVLVQRDHNGTSYRRQLTNFTARIIADEVVDNGAEIHRRFKLEAAVNGYTRCVSVSSNAFVSMNWAIEQLGSRAVIYPGPSTREHARTGIQTLSVDAEERYVYAHLGWRKIDDRWAYIHAGGAITASGNDPTVRVSVEGCLEGYRLPEVSTECADLRAAIGATLKVLDVAPDHVTIPLFSAVWRATIGNVDFSIYLAGRTGTGKSELAALFQQFFGSTLDARHLPAAWSSTSTALETLAFTAKDALLVIDDFVPKGSPRDVQNLHALADRVLRAVGNHAGRQRAHQDTTLRPDHPPRAFVVSTGEDIPHGASLRGRMLIIEVGPRDVQLETLTTCQGHAKNEVYARVMSAFLAWLAPRYEDVQKDLHKRLQNIRAAISSKLPASHRRALDIYASVILGMDMFLSFAMEREAISKSQRSDMEQRTRAALTRLAGEQIAQQDDSDPATRFLTLLKSALASYKAHLTTLTDGKPGSDDESFGWLRAEFPEDEEHISWHRQGQHIGWVDDRDVYLNPEVAYSIAQELASRTTSPLMITERVLWKRMDEAGLLVTRDVSRKTYRIRKQINGQSFGCIHIALDSLLGSEEPANSDNPDKQLESSFHLSGYDGAIYSVLDQDPTGDLTTKDADVNSHDNAVVGFGRLFLGDIADSPSRFPLEDVKETNEAGCRDLSPRETVKPFSATDVRDIDQGMRTWRR